MAAQQEDPVELSNKWVDFEKQSPINFLPLNNFNSCERFSQLLNNHRSQTIAQSPSQFIMPRAS